MAQMGTAAERRLAEEEEENDGSDESSDSSSSGQSTDRCSRPGFLFGNVTNRLYLQRFEMPDVQRESGFAFDRSLSRTFRSGATNVLSAGAGEQPQPGDTSEDGRLEKANSATDYKHLDELAPDEAPDEPLRDDAIAQYLCTQAAPSTSTAQAEQKTPQTPGASTSSNGVMKFQRLFIPDAGPPRIDRPKSIRGRSNRGASNSEQRKMASSQLMRNFPSDQAEAQFDYEVLEEDDEDITEQKPVNVNECPSIPLKSQGHDDQGGLYEDLNEVAQDLSSADNVHESSWAGRAPLEALHSVEQVDWERTVEIECENWQGGDGNASYDEPECHLEPLSRKERRACAAQESEQGQDESIFELRSNIDESRTLVQSLGMTGRDMLLDKPSWSAGYNSCQAFRRLPSDDQKRLLNCAFLDLNDPSLVFQSFEEQQREQPLTMNALSAFLKNNKGGRGWKKTSSESNDIQSKVGLPEREKRPVERALEGLRHYNISNDDLYAQRTVQDRERLQINKATNHIGVIPDIRHAAPALRLETSPPAATVEGLNRFHRPRAALYPAETPEKPWPPIAGSTDQSNEEQVITVHVRSLASGSEEVQVRVDSDESVDSLRKHAPRFFDRLKKTPKLYYLLNTSGEGKTRFRKGRVSDMTNSFRTEKITSGVVIFVVPVDVLILPSAKANAVPKPDKPRTPPAAFAHKEHLSALEGHIYLAEYLEEHPLHVQKPGMGAKRAMFYKKRGSEDTRGRELTKNTPLELHEFEASDKVSPFLSPLESGQHQETLETTLFRAPIYENEIQPTDLLLVRLANGRYMVREATAAFAVGYMEPHEEVPSPSSANVEEYYARRMKVYTHRLVREQQHLHPGAPPTVRAEDVLRLFPEDKEHPMFRGILNSFTDHDPSGPPEGHEEEYRLLKQGVTASEKELRDWLSPERVCCMEAMQAGVEQLRRAYINSAELHSITAQQLLNVTSQLSQDERLTNSCCAVENELLRSPWVQSSEFLKAVDGKVALELSTSMRAAQRTGRMFNYVRKLQRSREEQEKPDAKGAQPGQITGTAADLRKLSMEDAADYMRWLGCSEELINNSKRWDRIDIIRRLSKEAERKDAMRGLDLGRFVRSIKTPFRKQKEEQARNASKLFKRQSRLLSRKRSVSNVFDEKEESSESDSGYESLERRRQEALAAEPSKPQKVDEDEDEEAAQLELRKNLNQSQSGKKIKRLKMIVRRTQQSSTRKKVPAGSGDDQRPDYVFTVDSEVLNAYSDALPLGEQHARQKALNVINARRDMDGEESRLPGVQAMSYAGHSYRPRQKVLVTAGNELINEVGGQSDGLQEQTQLHEYERAPKAQR